MPLMQEREMGYEILALVIFRPDEQTEILYFPQELRNKILPQTRLSPFGVHYRRARDASVCIEQLMI